MYRFKDIKLKKIVSTTLDLCKSLKEESWMMTHQVSIINCDDQKKWYESLMNENVNNPRNLVLQAHEIGDQIIGIFKIFNVDYVNGSADVAWDVLFGWRGKGYGKQLVAAGTSFCFDILSLRRLNAEILATNDRSMKCALSAGFVVEGVKRQSVHKLGKYIDSGVYGLLRSDWGNGGIGKPTQ